MPRTVITGDDLSIQYFALIISRENDEVSNEERFKLGVSIAIRIIEAVLDSPQTEAEILARYYIRNFVGADLPNIVEDLIDQSEQKTAKAERYNQRLSYDALLQMASIILRGPSVLSQK